MGDDYKIPVIEKGSNKIKHVEFKNGLYVPSPTTKQNVQDEEEVESSTQSIRIEESILGVTPSLVALEFYEIFDISSSHTTDPEEVFEPTLLKKISPSILLNHSPTILLF